MARSVVLFARLTAITLLALMCLELPARADEMSIFVKRGLAYAEVKQDLESAIEGKGLKIGAIGDLGDMLQRTQAELGQPTAVYKSAHYLQFCSAKLAHKLTAADPNNVGHCPFLMFIYETVATPGDIVIGYRVFIGAGSPATRTALAEANALLESIANEAVK